MDKKMGAIQQFLQSKVHIHYTILGHNNIITTNKHREIYLNTQKEIRRFYHSAFRIL